VITLPLVLLLGGLAYSLVHFRRVSAFAAVVLLLAGYLLNGTFLSALLDGLIDGLSGLG
jgi:hypothetical protein